VKLTARLALSQLKVNRRRTIWTLVGIILSTAIITGVYSLGFGTGLEFIDRWIGESPHRATYYITLNVLAVILSMFIISISVIVVSNAFRVSAGERMGQFGILKSVGATKRQITATVVYEGLFLTIVGIPIGMMLGLIIQYAVVEIITYFVLITDPNIQDRGYGNVLRFIISSRSLLLSASVSLLTVMLSAWFPAKKAADIPAINTIRGIGEVDVKNKKVLFGGLIGTLFKTEGLLAVKFLKRSKRNFRATVVSISFSVILFVATGALFTQLNRAADLSWGGDITAEFAIWLDARENINISTIDEMTRRFQDFVGEDESVFALGEDTTYLTILDPSMITGELAEVEYYQWGGTPPSRMQPYEYHVLIMSVTSEMHVELAQLAGVSTDSNILINHAETRFGDGRRMEFTPFNFQNQTLTLENTRIGGGDREIVLHGELRGNQVPAELMFDVEHLGWIIILMPNEVNDSFRWLTDTSDATVFLEYAFELREEFGILDAGASSSNRQAVHENERSMVNLMMILTFGFVGILTAIGLTNVISTISENVRTRGKEFAVLQSVGMTREGIKKMLRLEAILCSAKALLIGLPVGILASFGLHQAVGLSATFPYTLPWIPILASVIGVFIITWITMQIAANKLKGRNIIETIRSGSGM